MSSIATAPAIAIESLGVRIGGATILHEITTAFPAEQTTCIIGPNGAGKTTLLHCMLGVIRPAHGSVRLGDVPLAALDQTAIARQIAFVPQRIANVPDFTVHEFVALSRYAHGIGSLRSQSYHLAAVDTALETLHVTVLAQRRLPTLSGGEMQKILLAAALAQETPILLLDEPTAFLDPAQADAVLALLHKITSTQRKTIIMVTHDLNSSAVLADHMLALRGGRVAYDGFARDALTPETLESIYGTCFVLGQDKTSGQPLLLPRAGREHA